MENPISHSRPAPESLEPRVSLSVCTGKPRSLDGHTSAPPGAWRAQSAPGVHAQHRLDRFNKVQNTTPHRSRKFRAGHGEPNQPSAFHSTHYPTCGAQPGGPESRQAFHGRPGPQPSAARVPDPVPYLSHLSHEARRRRSQGWKSHRVGQRHPARRRTHGGRAARGVAWRTQSATPARHPCPFYPACLSPLQSSRAQAAGKQQARPRLRSSRAQGQQSRQQQAGAWRSSGQAGSSRHVHVQSARVAVCVILFPHTFPFTLFPRTVFASHDACRMCMQCLERVPSSVPLHRVSCAHVRVPVCGSPQRFPKQHSV